jgi:hypothetical protein
MDSLDPDVVELDEGLHFNSRLDAANVWEFDVDPAIIDEATRIFEDGRHFAHLAREGEALESVATPSGGFFVARVLSWASDAAWVSADDDTSFGRLRDLFERLSLSSRFAHLQQNIRTHLGAGTARLHVQRARVLSVAGCRGFSSRRPERALLGLLRRALALRGAQLARRL